MNSKPQPHGR